MWRVARPRFAFCVSRAVLFRFEGPQWETHAFRSLPFSISQRTCTEERSDLSFDWLSKRLRTCGTQDIQKILMEEEARTHVTSHHLSLAIFRLVNARDTKSVEELVKQCALSNIDFSLEFYTTLLHSLQNNPKVTIQDISDIHQLVLKSFKPDLFYYTKIMKVLSKLGDFKEVDKYLDEMKQFGIHRDAIFYSVLIDGYAKHGKLQEGFDILQLAIEEGKADEHNFSPLLANAALAGDKKVTKNLFRKMKELGITPSILLFKRICLTIRGNISKLKLLLTEMQNFDIKPDTFMYNGLIELYVNQKNYASARSVLTEMIQRNISPNVSSFNIILSGYAYEGDVGGFLRILEEMEMHTVQPNIRTMNTKMKLFITRRNYDTAVEIFRNQIEGTYDPDIFSYTYLFEALGHLRLVNDIKHEMTKMRMNEVGMHTKVFTSYLGALGRCEAWSELELEFEEMLRSSSMKPDMVTFTAIMSVCAKSRNFELFDRVVEQKKKILGEKAMDKVFSNLIQHRHKVSKKRKV